MIKQKDIIDYIIPYIKEFKYNLKTEIIAGVYATDFKRSNGGIYWGGTKEEGKIFHAYCYGDLIFEHNKEGFFEDCIQTSKYENIRVAKKKGWIFGKSNYLGDIPICPTCKDKIKKILKEKNEFF